MSQSVLFGIFGCNSRAVLKLRCWYWVAIFNFFEQENDGCHQICFVVSCQFG